jgi:hypothetical protein
MAEGLVRARDIRSARGARTPEVLLPRDVSLPVGPHPHGPRPQLFDRGRHRPLSHDEGRKRPPPHRLGRAGDARRERGHQVRRPPPDLDDGQHRPHADPAPADGLRLRLVARGQLLPAGLLQMEPVDLPQDVRARARLPARELGQLVPDLPHRPGQRAVGRRDVLALLGRGRAEEDGSVVPEDHRLCRGAPDGARPARQMARARPADAEELDRPERGGHRRFPGARLGPFGPGVHHPDRYDLRGDVPRPVARALGQPRSRSN